MWLHQPCEIQFLTKWIQHLQTIKKLKKQHRTPKKQKKLTFWKTNFTTTQANTMDETSDTGWGDLPLPSTEETFR